MNEPATPDLESGEALGRDPRLLRARGLCALRAAIAAAGGRVPRSFGRGLPRPALSDQRRRRRRSVPAARIYDPRLPRLSRLAQTPAQPASYAYGGPVFRFPSEGERGAGELLQAGLESFGRDDREAADAEILAATLEAAAGAGAGELARCAPATPASSPPFSIVSICRPSGAGGSNAAMRAARPLAQVFAPPANGREHAGVLAALTKVDAKEARALVEDLLSIAGISHGRRPQRRRDRRALSRSGGARRRRRRQRRDPCAGRRFLRGRRTDRRGLGRAAAPCRRHRDRSRATRSMRSDTRSSFLAARGLDLETVRFSTQLRPQARLLLRLRLRGARRRGRLPAAADRRRTL